MKTILEISAQRLIDAWDNKSPLAWQPENNKSLIDELRAALLTVTELPTQDENSISQEWENIRREQSRLVMPLIGDLLDSWDELPNDVKGYEEWDRVAKVIVKIDCAMEGEGHIIELPTQEGRRCKNCGRHDGCKLQDYNPTDCCSDWLPIPKGEVET